MDIIIDNKKHKIRKYIGLAVIIIFLIILVFVTVKLYKPIYKLDKSEVIISTVSQKVVSKVINATGTLESNKKVDIESKESGQVVYINKKDGSDILPNDEILKLSNVDLENEYNNILDDRDILVKQKSISDIKRSTGILDYRNSLIDIEYEVLKSQKNLERDTLLFDTKTISREKLSQSEMLYKYWNDKKKVMINKIEMLNSLQKEEDDLYNLKINSNAKNLDFLKNRIDNLTIKSSCKGVFNLENINIGQYINSRVRIGTINIDDDYLLVSTIDEYYIPSLEVGSKAYFLDKSNNKYEVLLTYISNEVIDSKVKVEFKFNGAIPDKVKNGQRVDLKIIDSNIKKRLVINNGDFYNFTNGKWIFRIKDNISEKVPIETGFRDNQYVEVIKGLEVGDQVIISSYKKYKSYEKLKIKDAYND